MKLNFTFLVKCHTHTFTGPVDKELSAVMYVEFLAVCVCCTVPFPVSIWFGPAHNEGGIPQYTVT